MSQEKKIGFKKPRRFVYDMYFGRAVVRGVGEGGEGEWYRLSVEKRAEYKETMENSLRNTKSEK